MSDLETFRAETRAWLEANCPPSMRGDAMGVTRTTTIRSGAAAIATSRIRNSKLWLDRMGAQGLDRADLAQGIWRRRALATTKPRCWTQELARIKARPALMSFGIWMLGPVLLEYGNEEQKTEHPAEDRAAARSAGARAIPSRAPAPTSRRLQTKCEDKGDHCLINGQKIWTSYAD